MAYYECYLYRTDGTICGASPLLRDDDGAAIALARKIFVHRSDADRFEVWQDQRQIDVETEPRQAL